MKPQIKLSLYFSLQILIMAFLCAFLISMVNHLFANNSLNITLKSFSMIGIYTYTLGFGIALALMMIFRKNNLPFYLNQGLNTIPLCLWAYLVCLVSGLTIQLILGSIG